jgi:hypothetical protein
VMAECDDWRDAARLAAVVCWEALGFLVGEPPRLADEVEETPGGRVGIRVTGLVTVPPFWTGAPETLGQTSLWESA